MLIWHSLFFYTLFFVLYLPLFETSMYVHWRVALKTKAWPWNEVSVSFTASLSLSQYTIDILDHQHKVKATFYACVSASNSFTSRISKWKQLPWMTINILDIERDREGERDNRNELCKLEFVLFSLTWIPRLFYFHIITSFNFTANGFHYKVISLSFFK